MVPYESILNLSINKTKILMKRDPDSPVACLLLNSLTHRKMGHGIMKYTMPPVTLPLFHFCQIFWHHWEKSKFYGNSDWDLFGIIIIATEKKESKLWVCSGGHLEHVDFCIGSISYWTGISDDNENHQSYYSKWPLQAPVRLQAMRLEPVPCA